MFLTKICPFGQQSCLESRRVVCWGPHLYLDMSAATADIVLKFADDTKIAQRIRNDEDRRSLQAALEGLTNWANLWGMSFNVQKCKVMHVGHANPGHDYHMSDINLASTKEERDLGVIMPTNLKPCPQCAKAARTAQMVLGQLGRAFHFRDKYVFVRLYKTNVRPHLEFAGQAWAP